MWPPLPAKDGFDALEVQQGTRTVNQGIENLFHLRRAAEQQVAAELDLKKRVIINKTALNAFRLWQSKMKTGVDPTTERTVSVNSMVAKAKKRPDLWSRFAAISKAEKFILHNAAGSLKEDQAQKLTGVQDTNIWLFVV